MKFYNLGNKTFETDFSNMALSVPGKNFDFQPSSVFKLILSTTLCCHELRSREIRVFIADSKRDQGRQFRIGKLSNHIVFLNVYLFIADSSTICYFLINELTFEIEFKGDNTISVQVPRLTVESRITYEPPRRTTSYHDPPTTQNITEVTKSQRNRRRQRRLQIFLKNFTFEAWKICVK